MIREGPADHGEINVEVFAKPLKQNLWIMLFSTEAGESS